LFGEGNCPGELAYRALRDPILRSVRRRHLSDCRFCWSSIVGDARCCRLVFNCGLFIVIAFTLSEFLLLVLVFD
jgi:hypothetical protein